MAEIIADPVHGDVVVHEPEVCDVMLHFIRPGMCVVDAGANDGYFTGFMAHLVGDHGQVIAFEPDTALYQRLSDNVGECQNVVLRREALWSADWPMEFNRSRYSGFSSFVHYTDATEERYTVLARSLDTLLLSPQPQFMKIDCEGADEAVLRGAKKILERGVECITVEINYYLNFRLGLSDWMMRQYMADLGYDFFLLEHKRRPLWIPRTMQMEPRGPASYINAMFSTRQRVQELWSYDCEDHLRMRLTVQAAAQQSAA